MELSVAPYIGCQIVELSVTPYIGCQIVELSVTPYIGCQIVELPGKCCPLHRVSACGAKCCTGCESIELSALSCYRTALKLCTN